MTPEMQAYNAAIPGSVTAQAAPAQPDYSATLLQQASQKYPFVKKYNPVVMQSQAPQGPYQNDYAETWLPNDAGTSDYARPKNIPINGYGVNIYRPDKFGPDDLAAEFLHADPLANQTRASLLQSFSASQIENLKRQSLDYSDTIKGGEGEQKAMQNATDSALRGYTVGQWPDETNASMNYTPYQMQMLNKLKSYMLTGQQ